MQVVVSILFWGFMLASSIVLFPVALATWACTVLFDPRLVLLHRFSSFWASLYTWLNPLWNVRIEGREHIDREATYVIVSNHQSLLDILVLFRLHTHYKWVSKKENFRIPLIGWNMMLNRYIKIDRGSFTGGRQMMRSAEEAIATGNSILMFPEGTRSDDGTIRPFKVGAFELALRCRVPILPVIIKGTHNALPKRGFVLRGKHNILVRILRPVPYESIAGQDATSVANSIRGQLQREGETVEGKVLHG